MIYRNIYLTFYPINEDLRKVDDKVLACEILYTTILSVFILPVETERQYRNTYLEAGE